MRRSSRRSAARSRIRRSRIPCASRRTGGPRGAWPHATAAAAATTDATGLPRDAGSCDTPGMDITLGGTARGPLAGLRVLDVSTVVSGPLCTQVLGDLGADVWKVEGPRGDSTRMMGPPFRGGYTPIFAQFNRNKRSVVVDLKRPEALAVVRRLAGRADVLVENF